MRRRVRRLPSELFRMYQGRAKGRVASTRLRPWWPDSIPELTGSRMALQELRLWVVATDQVGFVRTWANQEGIRQ
jgi:hypothetical protein